MTVSMMLWAAVAPMRAAASTAPSRVAALAAVVAGLPGQLVAGWERATSLAYQATALAARVAAEIPAPGGSTAPPGVGTKLNTILSWSSYVGFGMCVLGLIVAGGLMAVSHRRGQSGEHVAGIGYSLAGAVLIGVAAALVQIFAA